MGLRSYFKKRVSSFERSTWTVGKNTWHYKAYEFWRENKLDEYSAPPARENFCHYWRIILFWAPLVWFLKREFKGEALLRPCTVVGSAIVLLTLIVSLIYWPGDVLTVLLWTLGSAVVVTAALGLAVLASAHEDKIKAFGHRVGMWLGEHLAPVVVFFTRWGDYFEKRQSFFSAAAPWALLVCFIAGLVISAILNFWLTIGVLVLVGVFFGLMFAGFALGDWLKARQKPKGKGDGFVSLSFAYITTKKRGICPYVDFENKQGEGSFSVPPEEEFA